MAASCIRRRPPSLPLLQNSDDLLPAEHALFHLVRLLPQGRTFIIVEGNLGAQAIEIRIQVV